MPIFPYYRIEESQREKARRFLEKNPHEITASSLAWYLEQAEQRKEARKALQVARLGYALHLRQSNPAAYRWLVAQVKKKR